MAHRICGGIVQCEFLQRYAVQLSSAATGYAHLYDLGQVGHHYAATNRERQDRRGKARWASGFTDSPYLSPRVIGGLIAMSRANPETKVNGRSATSEPRQTSMMDTTASGSFTAGTNPVVAILLSHDLFAQPADLCGQRAPYGEACPQQGKRSRRRWSRCWAARFRSASFPQAA